MGGTTKAGKDIEFLTCAAEDLDRLSQVKHGSVNLMTAGMAIPNRHQMLPKLKLYYPNLRM
ncbi:hypothetical protein INS49_011417 [Diaporthe citri]|uniref:uncharacterized protein n=1 Tax=Diaporthe citri TaxID=83186 RepID=UPI001C7FAE98|nr:uncharacterized protein INS49_011417 [Diaporthe citri]KAG6360359.1 hypothetical protein INS49_011417 [Diaporthe citri]